MKRLIFTLLVFALMATPAVAGPTLGWWDSEHPRATHQSFDFTNAEVDGGAYYDWTTLPEDVDNDSGISVAYIHGQYNPDTDSFSPLEGEDFIDLHIEIGNFEEPLAYKEIWVAVYSDGYIPEDMIDIDGWGPETYTTEILFGSGPMGTASFGARIWPNPVKEDLWFRLASTTGGTVALTGLTVDTICIPAPGAIILGSLGVGLVGWLRRRKSL